MNKVLQAKQAKQLYMQGATIRDIAQRIELNWKTVKKYVEGTPEDVCRYHRTVEREAELGLSNYKDFVIGELTAKEKSLLSTDRFANKAMPAAMNLSSITVRSSD